MAIVGELMSSKILVTGAGGFIGNALVTYLKGKGYWVRGVDIKIPEFSESDADQFWQMDLRSQQGAIRAVSGVDAVYHLAADMGGIGYISGNRSTIFRNNFLIDLNMLEAVQMYKIPDFLYSSSACVYPQHLQDTENIKGLKEEDAYPADAEPGYGWEKLMAELAADYYREDYGIRTRLARFHNIFGPLGTYEGGKEKAPAAICRKIAALPKEGGTIEVWGDGEQTRSFCYVDDCVEGLYRLMQSDYYRPLNIGQDRLVTINELIDIVADISGKRVEKSYDLSKPQGVRGRNSDNSKLKKVLNWEPQVSLEDGLLKTYKWIEGRVTNASCTFS